MYNIKNKVVFKKGEKMTSEQLKNLPLIDRFREERESGLRNSIYDYTQTQMSYHTNAIEGSKLSLKQTADIYDTGKLHITEGEIIEIDDIIETKNHFKTFDYIIDNVNKELSEDMIKELHKIMWTGTSKEKLKYFKIGDYKDLKNTIGNIVETTEVENVQKEMEELLREYNHIEKKTLENILDFHVKFERIHPFQDGNGRVGRLIMFKECLANNIIPFIVLKEEKEYYIRGLSEYSAEKEYLTDTCLHFQDIYKDKLKYFGLNL